MASIKSESIKAFGRDQLLDALSRMLLIRNFETRAESGYLQGNIGGFFHSYIGQEAIQVAAIDAMGKDNWWVTSYRCHALALLLGATPDEVMSELYGRANGNAKGRGGSMHLFTDRMLGGHGIVGGQIPIGTGAGFSLKYQNIKDQISITFLGDGAVPQGAFHESLNLASLWNLPCLYVIENNKWGMGTAFRRANAVEKLAEEKAIGYGIKGYTYNGSDYFECFEGFKKAKEEILTNGKPVLIEVICERFKGHSISDPGLYRSKDDLKACMATSDPIILLKDALIEEGFLTEDEFKDLDKKYREIAISAMKHAENSPWPNVNTLEQDVFSPEDNL